MKRTLIQFDEDTYEKLRHRAFQHRRSLSSIVRELVAAGLETGRSRKPVGIEQLASVAVGRSKQGRLAPVSENHDEALSAARRKK